jgi:anthranilate phosphoribosyltransferase
LVCGPGGFDEVSLSGPTAVREVRGGNVSASEWTPSDFGLDECRLEDLRVADAAGSAAMIRDVLDNRPGPARRVVVANAAAAFLAADRVGSLTEGVELADATIRSGRARQVLERLLSCT